jgi:hypothetical protein
MQVAYAQELFLALSDQVFFYDLDNEIGTHEYIFFEYVPS